MAFARTIRESHVAAHVIDANIRQNPRIDDIYQGLTWRLARQPELGYRVPNTNPETYVVHSYHWGVVAVVVAYQFKDDLVHIIDLQVTPYAGDE